MMVVSHIRRCLGDETRCCAGIVPGEDDGEDGLVAPMKLKRPPLGLAACVHACRHTGYMQPCKLGWCQDGPSPHTWADQCVADRCGFAMGRSVPRVQAFLSVQLRRREYAVTDERPRNAAGAELRWLGEVGEPVRTAVRCAQQTRRA